VSCSRVHKMTKYKTHCGVCSQCIDRRFGTLGAGLEEHDPEEMYEVRLLEDERDKDEDRTMAEAYVKTASDMRQMDTLKNLRFDSGSRPPMAEPGKWAFGGNAPQRGINTR